jgi:outer membrane lipoprotein SlyB
MAVYSRFSRCTILLLCGIFLSASGCTSKYGEQQTNVEFYSTCYQPIQDMREGEYTVQKATAAGIATGAVGGALIGLLSTGRPQGAVIGAVAGGIAGGMGGYFLGKAQQDENDQQRRLRYMNSVDTVIAAMDADTISVRAAMACYEREFTKLTSDYKSGALTKEAFDKRYMEITTGMKEANAILGVTVAEAGKIATEYQTALNNEAQAAGLSSSDVDTLKASNTGKAKTKVETKLKTQDARVKTVPVKAPKVRPADVKNVKKKVEDEQQFQQIVDLTERSETLKLTLSSMDAEQKDHAARIRNMEKMKNDLMV